MLKFASKMSPLIRTLLLLTLLVTLTGCGDVHWFPGNVRQPTDPNQFSFPSKTNVAVNTAIPSDSITVAGLTAATSPISITGPAGSNSMFSINGATPTSTAGTVKNGDTVTITQTSASSAGQSVTSTLTIGGVTGTFTTTTRVLDITFGNATTSGNARLVKGTVHIPGPGSHTISIRDSSNSGSAVYSLNNLTSFTNVEQTVLLQNNEAIFVMNLTSLVNSGVITTLTVDKVDFTVPLQ